MSSSSNTRLESVSVSSIMITDVKTAEENQSIQAVCRVLYENKIGSIVILKNSASENKESKKIPVGIVTERDIVRLVSLPDNKLSVDQPVHLLMKTPVITINPNRSVIDAMETMQQKHIRRLPVVDNEKLLGIVTDKDTFRVIVQNQQTLASGGTSDQILVDQQSIYGKFTDYWLRGHPITP